MKPRIRIYRNPSCRPKYYYSLTLPSCPLTGTFCLGNVGEPYETIRQRWNAILGEYGNASIPLSYAPRPYLPYQPHPAIPH